MRIFFVTNNYTPYSGGVISSITASTDALRAKGHEVFIVTLNFLGAKKHTDPDYVIRIPCPIKFMYKKNHMAIPWRPTHTITQLFKQYSPDIVHVHHPFLLGVSALRAARTMNIPCLFTYHTMYEQYAHYVPIPNRYAQPLIRSTVARFCNAVDGIIVPSSAVKEYLGQQRIKKPIQIIPSALRPLFFTSNTLSKDISSNTAESIQRDLFCYHRACLDSSKSSLLRIKLRKGIAAVNTTFRPLCARPELVEGYPRAPEKNSFKLLVVSRFVPEKNIPFVFDVFKQLPDTFSLSLVGYGSDYQRMQELAFDTLQLSPERIRFIHKPPLDDLLNIYRNADLFIFPSKTDTQGLVLAESMSQGLPVVALDGPGQRDIIVNGYNGFIVNSAQEMAKTIIAIASSAPLHHTLSSGAHATAQHYHTDSITKTVLNFYHTVSS